MTRMSKLILIAFLLVLIAAPTAFARLAAVGPLNPATASPSISWTPTEWPWNCP